MNCETWTDTHKKPQVAWQESPALLVIDYLFQIPWMVRKLLWYINFDELDKEIKTNPIKFLYERKSKGYFFTGEEKIHLRTKSTTELRGLIVSWLSNELLWKRKLVNGLGNVENLFVYAVLWSWYDLELYEEISKIYFQIYWDNKHWFREITSYFWWKVEWIQKDFPEKEKKRILSEIEIKWYKISEDDNDKLRDLYHTLLIKKDDIFKVVDIFLKTKALEIYSKISWDKAISISDLQEEDLRILAYGIYSNVITMHHILYINISWIEWWIEWLWKYLDKDILEKYFYKLIYNTPIVFN